MTEDTATTVIEPGWEAEVTASHRVRLEILNNLFMNIAEQMGSVLEKTAYSANIKERLDFSCAVFDPEGNLVANAPHILVHLGSMSECVKSVRAAHAQTTRAGQASLSNAPGAATLSAVLYVFRCWVRDKHPT